MGRKIKVQVYGAQAKKTALIEEGATVGATIGTDLRLPNGTVPTLAELAAALGVGSSSGGGSLGGLTVTLWRLIREVPIYTTGSTSPNWQYTLDGVAIGSVGYAAAADGIAAGSLAGDLVLAPVLGRVYIPAPTSLVIGLTAAQIAALPLDVSGSSAIPTTIAYELGAHGTFEVGNAPTFYGARVNTSISSPTAVVTGNSMFSLRAFGYDGDELALAGQMFIQAAENFSETNRGSNFRVDLVPIGSATIARAFVVQALSSGGFAIHGEEPGTPASEPTFSWRLDPDTGIGRTGTTNELAFLTAGTIKAVLTSAGRLIIGHTAALTIAGLTNPFQTISTGSTGWTAARFSADATGPVAAFGKSRGATIGAFDAVVTGDNLGQFNFGGSDGVNLNDVAGSFGVEVDTGTVSAGVIPGRFFFQTSTAAGALATALQLNSSQQALFEVGTAALPSLSYRQDPDTGTYRYATNGVGFAGAGIHRGGFDGSGKFLIGAPGNVFYSAVNSGGTTLGLQVVGTTIGTTGHLQALFANDTAFPRINFLKSRAAAPPSFAIVQAGDVLGSLRWSADDGTNYATDVVAQNVVIDGTPAANAISGYWQLAVNAGSSAATELARAGRYSNSGDEAYLRLTGNSNDTGTIDRTSAGLELLAVTMPNDGLFPLIKWMSSDAQLTTNNPRMVAFIGVRSTQVYDGDTDGGARIVFGSNAVDPGTGDPAIYISMQPTDFLVSTARVTINPDPQTIPAAAVASDTRLLIVDNASTAAQQLAIGGPISLGNRYIAAGGTFASPTAVNTTDIAYMGYIGGAGFDGTNWQTGSAGLVGIRPAGTWSGTDRSTRVVIETTPVGSTTRGVTASFDPAEIDLTATLLDFNGAGDFSSSITVAGAGIFSASAGAVLNGWSINMTNVNPGIAWRETDGAADAKAWDMRVSTGVFIASVWADDYATSANWMRVARTGIVVDEFEINATTFDLNGALDVSGNGVFAGDIIQITNSAGVELRLVDSDSGSNQKQMGWLNSGGQLRVISRSDVGAFIEDLFTANVNTSGLWTSFVLAADAVTFSQSMFWTGTITPTQLAANTDNWAPTGFTTAYTVRASTDASRNLTGIAAGADGRRIQLINVGAQDLVLIHDATSTAANRFLLPNSTNLTLNPNDSVILWYDTTSSRWRVVAAAV